MAVNEPLDIKFDPLDTQQKERVRQKISEALTPELKSECSGLVILVLTYCEHELMMECLKNESIRKQKIRNGRCGT